MMAKRTLDPDALKAAVAMLDHEIGDNLGFVLAVTSDQIVLLPAHDNPEVPGTVAVRAEPVMTDAIHLPGGRATEPRMLSLTAYVKAETSHPAEGGVVYWTFDR